MKKKLILLMALGCLLISEIVSSATPIPIRIDREKAAFPNSLSPYFFSVQGFLSLTPKKHKKITGKKMSLFQKLFLRLKQQKFKQLQKEEKNGLSDFDGFGFILGLFLSILGVGISYLYKDKNMIKWAWRGAAIGAIFILVSLLL